jgi:F-type H+-transporting ATPase subunit a
VRKLFTPKVLLPTLVGLGLLVALFFIVPKVALPAIEIAAEPVFQVAGFSVTNTLLAGWISMLVLILLAYFGTRRMTLVPTGLQNFLETVVEAFLGLVENMAGHKWGRRFFPIVMTIFLFLLISNWMGMLPFYGSVGHLIPVHEGKVGYQVNALTEGIGILTGVKAEHGAEGYMLAPFLRSAATDLNLPLALALISVVMTQVFGVRSLGLRYFGKFVNVNFKHGVFNGIIGIIVGFFELVSETAKIISFTFRLFGNIFAGEILLGVLAFLIPYLISIPFYGLELFVGAIQALVFAALTLVFFTLAVKGHDHEGGHAAEEGGGAH